MAKYNLIYNECRNLKPLEIIEKYNLSQNEIDVMKFMYDDQLPKEDIIQHFQYKGFNDNSYPNTKFVSSVLGSLKNKGLIYSVDDLAGWLGTEIRV